jgi:hypothetical protein
MTRPLIPQAFWFRIAVPAPRIDEIPRADASPRLLDLPAACALPDFKELEGRAPWAQVRLGWNLQGLGLMVLAEGVSESQLAPDRPEGFAEVQFWIDTRDTRDVSRATRFCHRYVARLKLAVAGTKRKLKVSIRQQPIARAVADAPLCPSEIIASRAELNRSGWVLEVFLPAAAMNGFDPESNRRLGLAYQVADHVRDDQFLGVARDFPIGENPSLWATLELRD